MSFFIRHPDEWIGVPERWPFPAAHGGEYATVDEWLTALVDELTLLHEFAPEVRARVHELLAMAAQRGQSARSRVFVAFEAWDGPAYVVEAVAYERSRMGAGSLADAAGADDPTQLGAAYSADFTTEDGTVGAVCVRYLPLNDHGVVYGRVDYAFADDDELLILSGGEIDLVDFEKLKPRIERLAATVSASPASVSARSRAGL